MEPPEISPAKSKKRRYTLWLLLLLVLLTAGGYTAKRLITVRSPFSDANKILASIPWDTTGMDFGDINSLLYTWQDNETIIYGLCDKNENCRLMQQKVRGQNISAVQPVSHIPSLYRIRQLAVSPNGKWLLTEVRGKDNYDAYTVFSLNTGEVKQKYPDENSFVTWMRDSHSFCCYDYYTRKIVQYNVDRHQTKPYPLKPQFNSSVQVSPSGEYFSASDYPSHTNLLQHERGSVITGKSQVQTIPHDNSGESWSIVSVSPQGDRLLWFQYREEVSWMDKLMSRLTDHQVEPKKYERFYVTDASGGNPRDMFILSSAQGNTGNWTGSGIFPQWLPDGKHLSFVYKGALYVVDTP